MKIVLYFAGVTSVSVNAFEDEINIVRNIVASLERSELARIRSQVPELPRKHVKDALKAFDSYGESPECLRIGAVKPGSVEVVIILTALGYWLLNQTVGETLKDAWKETELNKNIKKFFLSGKASKLQSIVNEINEPNYERIEVVRRSREVVSVEIKRYAKLHEDTETITIRVMKEETETSEVSLPPTWEEIEIEE